MEKLMIEFDKVNLLYAEKHVLKDFTLKIQAGEKVAILGKSGLGKSSLFHLLLGFIPSHGGRIFFQGAPVSEATVWEVRKNIAFVDQDVSVGSGRVHEFLQSVFALKTNSHKKFSRSDIDPLLEYFELNTDDLHKNIEDLSGGERQRVAIITSILLDRDVFLFDEITSSLDFHLKQKTVEFFMSKPQWTVVVISHDSVWLDHPGVRVFNLQERRWKQ